MNFKLLLILLIMTNGIFAQKLDKNIFDKIYKFQKEEGDSIAANWFCKIHQSLNKFGKLKFINECDSVFILEKLDIETGVCYGRIWNNQKVLDYKYYTYPKQNFDFSAKNVFSQYIQNLISNWDIETIKKDEKENSLISANNIFSYRIVLGDTIKIDYLHFQEFHDPR